MKANRVGKSTHLCLYSHSASGAFISMERSRSGFHEKEAFRRSSKKSDSIKGDLNVFLQSL